VNRGRWPRHQHRECQARTSAAPLDTSARVPRATGLTRRSAC